jgi:hypothetical protein
MCTTEYHPIQQTPCKEALLHSSAKPSGTHHSGQIRPNEEGPASSLSLACSLSLSIYLSLYHFVQVALVIPTHFSSPVRYLHVTFSPTIFFCLCYSRHQPHISWALRHSSYLSIPRQVVTYMMECALVLPRFIALNIVIPDFAIFVQFS